MEWNRSDKESIQGFAKDLEEVFTGKQKYVVFLCGPRLDLSDHDSAAALRLRLMQELEADGFEVVLGEDEGLNDARLNLGVLAHENELRFIQNQANSVLLIAASVGSFCELGLFSYSNVRLNFRQTELILLLDSKYKGDNSYLNNGPAKAVDAYGKLIHGDFANFDTTEILDRLRYRRYVWYTSTAGRPKGDQ